MAHILSAVRRGKAIGEALPKLAKAAESEDLSDALNSHLEETRTHVQRLEEVFQMMKTPAKGKPCKGMKGLIEGNEGIQETDEGELRDLAIIAACQKVEHYEISGYGTIRTLAEQLEIDDAISLLEQTEDEEKQADEKLTDVAMSIYKSSAGEEQEQEEEDEVAATSASSRRSGGEAKPATRKAGR